MPRLTLYYGFERLELDVDVEDGVETLFYQIFSVTNVSPEAQVLFGLVPGPFTLSDAASAVVTIVDGQEIAMLEPVPGLLPLDGGTRAYSATTTRFLVSFACWSL